MDIFFLIVMLSSGACVLYSSTLVFKEDKILGVLQAALGACFLAYGILYILKGVI